MVHPENNGHLEPLPGAAKELMDKLESRTARLCVIGLGYVGLPLAMAALRAGFNVTGYDINSEYLDRLRAGKSSVGRISGESVVEAAAWGKLLLTDDPSALAACDVVVICVPTPLDRHREPDLSYIVSTAETIGRSLHGGMLISLESTTYPGTTREVVKPILERGGLVAGTDFFLCFSPEREDPGNPDFHTATIPKVVGGDGAAALALATAFYGSIVEKIVPVETCEVAEAVKLTENIFRSVNIALMNELKTVYDKMGINVWDVIAAAKTKPFGYMPFYPGPGLGGHCIPIDPFYLSWKAREFEVPTRFIELAGEVNTHAPYLVIDRLAAALGRHIGVALARAHILVIGVAYKKNVEDTRESPAFKLIELIEKAGGRASFHDPFVPVIPRLREHPDMSGRKSEPWNAEGLAEYDAVLICTDHDGIDYPTLAARARLVVDTRNALKNIRERGNVVMA